MGAYLSRPEKEKSHEEGENDLIRFAATSMQGWRTHQEDAHNCIMDFVNGCSLFAVYDGHGGSEVSTFLKDNFPDYLKEHKLLHQQPSDGDKDDGLVAALQKLFVKFDDTLRRDETVKTMTDLKTTTHSTLSSSTSADHQQQRSNENGREEKEQMERENLLEEAYALSQEANISIEQIIKQYAKCRNLLIERVAEKLCDQQPSPQDHTSNADEADKNNSNSALDSSSGDGIASSKRERKKRPIMFVSPQLSKRIKMQNLQQKQSPTAEEDDTGGDELKKQQQKHQIEQRPLIVAKAGADQNGTNATDTTAPHSSTSDNKVDQTAAAAEEDEEEDDDPDYQEENVKIDEEEEETTSSGEEADEDEEEEEEADEEEEEEEDLEMLLNSSESGNKAGFDSGSTACVALLFKQKIVVANIGDSRCVLCRAGKAIELSLDHKPEDAKEKDRIEAAGGSVSEDGRVNGGLNLTRAFGDHYYKQTERLPLKDQMITALPDVTITERDEEADQFIIVACDGIWNSMTSQEVCDFVSERIGTNTTLKQIGADICDHCCAKDTSGDGSGCDNETVIIIDLKKATRRPFSCANSAHPLKEAASCG